MKNPLWLNQSGNYTVQPVSFPERLWDGLYSIEKRLPECLLLFIFDLQPCVCGWIEDEGLGMCLADDGVEKWIVVSLSFKCTYSPAPALGSSWGMQPCLTLKAVTGGILLFSRDSVIFRMKIHSCLTSARVLPRCLIFSVLNRYLIHSKKNIRKAVPPPLFCEIHCNNASMLLSWVPFYKYYSTFIHR